MRWRESYKNGHQRGEKFIKGFMVLGGFGKARAKAPLFRDCGGTAKAVPFHKAICGGDTAMPFKLGTAEAAHFSKTI